MKSTFVILKFKHAHLKFPVSGWSKHTHTCAQCSHASVGLAQARLNDIHRCFAVHYKESTVCYIYIYILFDLLVYLLLFPVHVQQECMMTSFYLRREEEEHVTSYFGRGESRIFLVYYKYM